jgi:cysteine desulfuration protein SufE
MENPLLIDWLGKPAYIGGMNISSTIDQTTQEIIDEFAFFDDWVQRYEYIIEMGKALTSLPDQRKDEAHRVPGCQSQVWFHARRENGEIHFDADSDAMIVRGLIALLLRVYSGRTPEEIISTPPEFFEVLELGSHLSGSRANGLHAMVTRIHAYAKAFRDDKNPDVEPIV